MATRPRILMVRSWKPAPGEPTSGGQQRLALLERSLRAIGELEIVHATRWSRPWWKFWQPMSRNANEAALAALHVDLRNHRPPSRVARAFAAQRPESYDLVVLHRLSAAWWTGWTDPTRTIL